MTKILYIPSGEYIVFLGFGRSHRSDTTTYEESEYSKKCGNRYMPIDFILNQCINNTFGLNIQEEFDRKVIYQKECFEIIYD